MNQFERDAQEYEDRQNLCRQINNILAPKAYIAKNPDGTPKWDYAKKVGNAYYVLVTNTEGGSTIVRIDMSGSTLDAGSNWIEVVKSYKVKRYAVEFYKKQ